MSSEQELELAHAATTSGFMRDCPPNLTTCQKALLTKFSNPPMLIRETEGVRWSMSDSNVSAFPLHRRRKLVEGIARVLESKNGEDANAFWRSTAKTILVQLSESGIAPGVAEQEVGTLLHVVLADIATRSAAKLAR